MATTDTATIRVSRDTRDLLAEQARERGVSLSAMLTDLARQAQRESIFQAEREATRRDAEARDAQDEDRDWEATLADGTD
jgi:hypothetical protein